MYIQNVLRYYFHTLHRYMVFIICGMLLSGGITLAISLMLPPVYEARALLRVNGTTATTGTTGSDDVFSTQALAVSYALLVTSSDVLQDAAKQLPGTSFEQLRQVVSASPLDDTQLIEIRAQADRPQQAALIASTVTDSFIKIQGNKESTRLQHAMEQLSQTLTQTRFQIIDAQQQLADLQNKHAEAAAIARQQSLLDGYQANYTSLLTGYSQLQTRQIQAHSMLSIAQDATAPGEPSSPHVWLNTVLAAALGLLAMIMLALLLDWLDITIQTEQDVIHLARLTPLGCIPYSQQGAHLLDLTREESDEARDAYSLLGMSLLARVGNMHTLLVTALHRGTGTSTTALHIAVTLAQAGRRVLLVDAHARRPILHTIFKQSNTAGLTTALPDMYTCRQRPDTLPRIWLNRWKTFIPDLWFLPAGPVQPSSATVLRQPALCILRDLFTDYTRDDEGNIMPPLVDYIIFDAPPLQEGIDAQSLATVAETTILVIEAGKERQDTLRHARGMLQRLGAPILGLVVNQQRKHHRSYFYGASEHASALPEPGAAEIVPEPSGKTPEQQPAPATPSTPPSPVTTLAPEVKTQRMPTISLSERPIDTPLPPPITPIEQDLASPDPGPRKPFQDTNDSQAGLPPIRGNLQFAPRLRVNNSGGIKPLPIDEPKQEEQSS